MNSQINFNHAVIWRAHGDIIAWLYDGDVRTEKSHPRANGYTPIYRDRDCSFRAMLHPDVVYNIQGTVTVKGGTGFLRIISAQIVPDTWECGTTEETVARGLSLHVPRRRQIRQDKHLAWYVYPDGLPVDAPRWTPVEIKQGKIFAEISAAVVVAARTGSPKKLVSTETTDIHYSIRRCDGVDVGPVLVVTKSEYQKKTYEQTKAQFRLANNEQGWEQYDQTIASTHEDGGTSEYAVYTPVAEVSRETEIHWFETYVNDGVWWSIDYEVYRYDAGSVEKALSCKRYTYITYAYEYTSELAQCQGVSVCLHTRRLLYTVRSIEDVVHSQGNDWMRASALEAGEKRRRAEQRRVEQDERDCQLALAYPNSALLPTVVVHEDAPVVEDGETQSIRVNLQDWANQFKA